MLPRTCVAPQGHFIFLIHKPAFETENLRQNEHQAVLGKLKEGQAVSNQSNFPSGNVIEPHADWIYEIPNPFAFRGTTYIGKTWADRAAVNPSSISLPMPSETSLTTILKQWMNAHNIKQDSNRLIDSLFSKFPRPVLLSLAVTSTDPEDLIRLAQISGQFIYASDGKTPEGMVFKTSSAGKKKPIITDIKLFEAVANNPCLPDIFKKVMVLVPGIQGGSEIVGEYQSQDGETHVFEYLRRNSYIPWGHYAANMAHDAVRYRHDELTSEDVSGMRHLYYQRTYARVAQELALPIPFKKQTAGLEELEGLRKDILTKLADSHQWKDLKFDRTLWGWNFGFDFAPTGYRLHASHQQVHQQFAMIPKNGNAVALPEGTEYTAHPDTYACGDLIAEFIEAYHQAHGVHFFPAYEKAIQTNPRMDGASDKPHNLVVYQDDHVLLFVPKAQTSQWELQLMPKSSVGNILHADSAMRTSLDRAIWTAICTLGAMGAKMVTAIEFSQKFAPNNFHQRLLYSFLPRLPESPGAFSEAQLRWINGHYPEDFAEACRSNLPKI